MKKLIWKRSLTAAIEPLENRCLLTATVLAQIPTQNLTVGATTATKVTLSTFLNDPQITGGTVIEMQTPLGNMFFQLDDSQTPNTVANFVTYINNGEYTPTMIQRSVPGFVLQGGGTMPDGANNNPVQSLNGEPGISNTTGTIAMALSDGPDTGTNQWFINLADNSSILDGTSPDNGPFTVFGNVIDGGIKIANAIAALPIIDGSNENSQWSTLPVINYTGSTTPSSVPEANIVTDNIVQIPTSQAAPTYSATSNNPSLVTAKVVNGVLKLKPVSGATAGQTTVMASVTDVAGQTATTSFIVNVVSNPVAHLAFIQSPTNVKAGHVITPAITVSVTDANNNPITGANVNLAIASGPGGAVLDGTLKVQSVDGVATFSNISLTVAGAYTMEAIHGSVTSEPSGFPSFDVRHTMATQLAFTARPAGTTVGTDIAPPITVNVEDQYGNIVTNNASSVTLSLKPGLGPDGAILGGTLTESASGGVATFSDISVDEAGTYKLIAEDGDLTNTKSKAFTIVAGS
ncbi:MAG: peptidylprolyl isomerase [Tepidisphaeraceae bacterium]|jgi:cyclophilin family peptidyl-prolyl cis-trans isomerase